MKHPSILLLAASAICAAGTGLVFPAAGLVVTADARPHQPHVTAVAPAVLSTSEPIDTPGALDPPLPVALDTAVNAGVSPHVLQLALGAIRCAVSTGDIEPPPTLTLIDYSRPSTEPRLWVFDLQTGALRFRELVAHGKGSGDNLARQFSDDLNSHQSSLGLFVTADTYVGSNGYSLRLDGLEPGFNGRARERAIVMHGAAYVDAGFAAAQGRLGRSWGCPALRTGIAHQVIDVIRGGGVLFSYYPDDRWLEESRFLHCPSDEPETRRASID